MLSTAAWGTRFDDRMKDSLQHVHSSPCSQITGMRGLVSMAATILGNHGSFQAHGRRGRGAEFEDVPSIDAVRSKDLVSRRQTFRLAHNHLLGRHELPASMERGDSKIRARRSNQIG